MNYSRAAFREWLTTLPQDKPFCDGVCPIANWLGTSSARATVIDNELTVHIDRNTPFYAEYDELRWEELTPCEVINIIDQLEAV